MKQNKYYILILLISFSLQINLSAQKLNKLIGTKFPKEVLEVKLYTQSGETVLFKDVLKELEGNVIYLDFWASSCGSCIKEMPYSKKVQQYFNKKNIAFLYLSTDKKQKNWINGLNKINIKGNHYRINTESKIHFKNLFKIKGIPFYTIIDKNGNIADPKAKWPREQKLIDDIEKILAI